MLRSAVGVQLTISKLENKGLLRPVLASDDQLMVNVV